MRRANPQSPELSSSLRFLFAFYAVPTVPIHTWPCLQVSFASLLFNIFSSNCPLIKPIVNASPRIVLTVACAGCNNCIALDHMHVRRLPHSIACLSNTPLFITVLDSLVSLCVAAWFFLLRKSFRLCYLAMFLHILAFLTIRRNKEHMSCRTHTDCMQRSVAHLIRMDGFMLLVKNATLFTRSTTHDDLMGRSTCNWLHVSDIMTKISIFE